SRIERRRGDIKRPWLRVDRAMPDASAESRDVDLVVVQWIGNHPVSPLEIESGNSGPMQTAVYRSPCRRLKACRIEHVGILRINRNIVNVAIPIEHRFPALPAILRQKDSSAVSVFSHGSSPGGTIDTIWRSQIDG